MAAVALSVVANPGGTKAQHHHAPSAVSSPGAPNGIANGAAGAANGHATSSSTSNSAAAAAAASGVTTWKRGELRAMALRGVFDAVKRLVEEGVDVESRDSFNGRTALLCAVYGGRYDVIEYLALKGANVEAKDKAGHNFRDYTTNHKTMKTDIDPPLVLAAINRGTLKRRLVEALRNGLHASPIGAIPGLMDLIVMYS